MSEATNQISRREILKRGAFVGGAIVWATPVVQTLGMGRAFAATPSDTCVESMAVDVVSFNQGLTKGGDPVPPNRSIKENVLNSTNAFVSLGYGGEIVVRLGVPYFSGKNGEALVVETTFAAPNDYEERALVYVAQNLGGPWTLLTNPTYASNTTAVQTETIFLLDPQIPNTPYYHVSYVKLKDATDLSLPHPDHSDGFDATRVGIRCPGTNPQ